MRRDAILIEADDPKIRNIEYLDALVSWAENLVELKTAILYGERDENGIASLRSLVSDAEATMHRIANEMKAIKQIPFESLVSRYNLNREEIQILRIALAPALDSSFRKRIARYKDNVLLDYVDVDFVISILFDQRKQRLLAMDYLLPSSRLVSQHLITLKLPRDATTDTFIAHEICVPDRLVNYVLGHDYLDKSISSFCSLGSYSVSPETVIIDEKIKNETITLLKGWLNSSPKRALVFGLSGAPGSGKTLFTKMLASIAKRPMITVDSAKLSSDDSVFKEALENIFLDAKMRESILVFDNCESLFSQKNPRIPSVYSHLEKHDGIVCMVTNDPKQLDSSLERYISYQIDFEQPDVAMRESLWRLHLDGVMDGCSKVLVSEDVDVKALAQPFEFFGGQIKNAVQVARDLATSRGSNFVTQEDLTQGAWAQVRADMEEYSKKRKARLTLDDLILPEEEMRQVRDLIDAAKHRVWVLTHWGFGKRLTSGKGLVCLFVGEPGTGKTLCAEILAETLGQKLYQISIPRVMSKYIGETEKNIERIFSTARANNSILLFDEADALFTSRVKVETSVDRFSNMEINLMLQEIEAFEGIVLLTSNLEKNIDKAFERRIQFKIRFPFPDKKHRALIWKSHIPKECPIDPNIDWDLVGESFEISGGSIKNAILRAAYMAARDRKPIDMATIVRAAEAECRHVGRLFRGLKKEDI